MIDTVDAQFAWRLPVGFDAEDYKQRNTIERACMLADGPFITDRDVTVRVPVAPDRAGVTDEERASAKAQSDAGERERLVAALAEMEGNKQAAARTLGISTRAFYRRLERHGLHTAVPAAAAATTGPPDPATPSPGTAGRSHG